MNHEIITPSYIHGNSLLATRGAPGVEQMELSKLYSKLILH